MKKHYVAKIVREFFITFVRPAKKSSFAPNSRENENSKKPDETSPHKQVFWWFQPKYYF